MAIIGLFQCDPWCLPTQKWLKNATNDISIQEFHNITRHYVKDTGSNNRSWLYECINLSPMTLYTCNFFSIEMDKSWVSHVEIKVDQNATSEIISFPFANLKRHWMNWVSSTCTFLPKTPTAMNSRVSSTCLL